MDEPGQYSLERVFSLLSWREVVWVIFDMVLNYA